MVTRIEHPKFVQLAGADGGSDVGTAGNLELDPGDYEVRCSAPVRIRLGQTEAMSTTEVLVLPSAPLHVALSGVVVFAAASTTDATVWVLPLKRST